MIDYILINKNHMSLTFVCTGRPFMSPTRNLSCLLCTSKSRPSVDTQRHHATKPPTSPLLTRLATSQLVLAEAYDKFDQTSSINAHWDSFKSSIQKACESRPPAPKISDPDWITDEVRNLSRKKKEAWAHLRNAPPQDISHLKTEYSHLKKLTKVSAEKARSSWWSESAAEAERQALAVEQQGKGGSLIRGFVLQKKFSKPASSALVAKDGKTLQSSRDKLNRWAEHFTQEVVNCQVDIDVIPIEDLPVNTLHSTLSDTTLSDHDLSFPLSEKRSSCTAISELRSGKASGLERYLLGDAQSRRRGNHLLAQVHLRHNLGD